MKKITMKYESPTFEIIDLIYADIVTLSGTESGDGDGTEGPWA